MKTLEQEGKTANEAIELALKKLGVSREEAKIEILDEGNRGLFGLVGSKPAKVKVTVENSLGKKAIQIIEEILSYMKIEARIETKNEKENTLINIKSPDSRIIIGKRGQTLNSLQYLVNLLLNKNRKSHLRGKIIIDTENYRRRRENTLSNLALRLANKVDKTKREFRLEPMSAQERRIIHATLQNHKYVTTKSMGEGVNRRVVIVPKQK
jgi:spoIIIJ-associated protein